MTQTSFYEHGNTLFADTFYCGVGGATGTLEAKVAKRNDYGVWGVSVTLFDYADGVTHQLLVVSPAGYAELQAQPQPPDEDVTVVMAEYEKQYITDSETMRLVMTVSELTYLEDIAMPNHYFARIRFNFEVIAK
ncbi:MAG: hypothetical protein SH821_14930 [Phototrophicales bacterium]|nr:hypothetical protein [Phototrophicales bacterium]